MSIPVITILGYNIHNLFSGYMKYNNDHTLIKLIVFHTVANSCNGIIDEGGVSQSAIMYTV